MKWKEQAKSCSAVTGNDAIIAWNLWREKLDEMSAENDVITYYRVGSIPAETPNSSFKLLQKNYILTSARMSLVNLQFHAHFA